MNPLDDMRVSLQEDFLHVNGVQIYRDKELIFAEYRNGFTGGTLHPTGCIFKSFISAATGVAIKDGLIESVDQKIADFFPHLHAADPNLGMVTIRHALTKTTGVVWPPPGSDAVVSDMAAVFSLNTMAIPGEAFEYKPDPQMLVYLLSEITGMPFEVYVKQAIFDPLGIEAYQWDTSMSTIQNMKMSMKELAKLGMLYLHGGTWNGFEILKPSYVKDSLTVQIEKGFPEQAGYGYLWWIGNIGKTPVFFSSGFGGQYLIIVPEKKIIVVITSKMDRPHPENKIIVRNLLSSNALG